MTGVDDLPGPDWPDELLVPVHEIGVDGDNPNEMEDEQFTELLTGIREDGWLQPILVKPAPENATHEGEPVEYLIADGEHRWKAAKDELNLQAVPALVGDDWSESQRRMVRQRMNKVHGQHDPTADALEFDQLVDDGYRDEVLDLLDARDENLDDYLDMIRVSDTAEVEAQPDPQEEVIYDDCVNGLRQHVADDDVDCVVTDPPYGVDIDLSDSFRRTRETQHAGDVEADKSVEEAADLWDATMAEIDRVTKPDAHLYCFASWKTTPEFRAIIEDHGWTVQNYIIWRKKDANHLPQFGGAVKYAYTHEFCLFATKDNPRGLQGHPNDHYVVNEPRFEAEWLARDVAHPTMKPVTLLEEFIKNSTSKGDLVLDPFLESGSTAVAALKLGRDAIGFEMDEENYREVIDRRIHQAKRQRDSPQNQTPDDDTEIADDPAAGETEGEPEEVAPDGD